MTISIPEAEERTQPVYREIADAIARQIRAGTLTPGSRLPTQRDLAHQLGVTVTTVTRGYLEAQRRGLITGEVGRGTYIRAHAEAEAEPVEEGPINLSTNALLPFAHIDELADRLGAVASTSTRLRMFDYQPRVGSLRNRAAGANWIARTGLEVSCDRVVVTAGGQHAILIALMTLTKPGDEIFVEEFTYAGVKNVANRLQVNLRTLPMDDSGLVPEALDRACRSTSARVLYTMPTLQNPTSVVMPDARRRKIAAVAAEHNLVIIEDDVYGYLVPDARPLSRLLPEELTFYITSTSKSIAPGMRVGYLVAPTRLIERLSGAVFRTIVNAPPVMAELATTLITDGTAGRIVEWKQKETSTRQEMARRILKQWELRTHPFSPHIWMYLPQPWRAQTAVARARQRGVLVNAAEEFAVGHETTREAIRICLGPPRSRASLEEGLTRLARTLEQAEESTELVV